MKASLIDYISMHVVYNFNKNSILEIIRLKVPYKSIYANKIIQYEDIGICNVVCFGGAVIKN